MQKVNFLTYGRFFVLFIFAISCPLLLTSQSNLVIGQTQNVAPGLPSDYIIPAMGGDLVVTLRGGDGGGIRFSGLFCETTVEGGSGATINATFEIGFAPGQLQPGGTIRAMVGQKGWSDSKACGSGAASYAGGGGSTAILYLPPNTDPTGINWQLLAVAGAGGGASRPSSGIDRTGQGATAGDPSGGVNGVAGAYGGADGNIGTGNSFIVEGRPGAGYNGGNCAQAFYGNCVGYYSMVDTAIAGTTPILVKLMDNAYYNYTGDRSTFYTTFLNGGNGFTGGGAGSTNAIFGPTAGAGGGGFSGGSVNYYFGGGGGSSHIASGVNTSNVSISPGANGASGHVDGFITMTVNAAPIITQAKCQNQTVQLDGNGQAGFNASQLNNGSTGFAPLTYTVNGQSTLNFTCADVGTIGLTLTLTDAYNTTSTCSATITVVDMVGPTASCQDATVQLNAMGNGFISTCAIDAGSSDACGGFVGYALSHSTFNCDDIGTAPITLTVTDINGNANTCTANVTIQDNIRPTAICQDLTIQLDANGNASASADAVHNSSSDACGVAGYVLDNTNFNCLHLGSNAVVLTVSDGSSNTSTCTATVTVQDNVAPMAVCQDVTLQLDAGGSGTLTPQAVDGGSNDVCGIANRSLSQTSFSCANLGYTTLSLTVTDNSGLSNTCTASVNVRDDLMPTAQCQNLAVQLDETGQTTVDANQFDNGSTDNCSLNRLYFDDFSTTRTYDCNDVGTLSLSNMIVEDNAGNLNYCNVTLTLEDNVAPIASCPGTIVTDAQNLAGGPLSSLHVLRWQSFTAEHSGFLSSIEVLIRKGTQGGAANAPISINIYAGEGLAGNLLFTTTHTVTLDNTQSWETLFSNAAIPVQVGNIYTLSLQAPSTTNLYWLVDGNNPYPGGRTGLPSIWDYGFNTFVKVNTPIIVQLDANGAASLIPEQVDSGSSDACGIADLSLSQTDFTCANVASNSVTLTVTDNNGNSSNCQATVTIEDNEAPTISCPANITVDNDPGICGAVINYPSVMAQDNCTGWTVSQSNGLGSGATFPVGTTTESYTVVDASGNQSSCSFTVTVNKSGDPELLSAYTVIGFKGVEMKANTVGGGGIGVVKAGKKVKLEENTMITESNTFVKAPQLDLNGGSEVSNFYEGQVDVDLLPSFQSDNACNNDLDIPDDSEPVVLDLNCYGKIVVGKNVSITFSGHAVVSIEEIELKEGASVFFDQPTNLLIEKEFKGGKELLLSNEGYEVWVFAKKAVKIEESSEVTANIYTLEKLEVEKGIDFATTMTGLFISADKVVSKENVFWNWSPTCFPEIYPGGSNLTAPSNSSQVVIGSNLQPELEIAPELTASPNPFANRATIRFTLPDAGQITLEVFSLNGQRVKVLETGYLDQGSHEVQWAGKDQRGRQLESGIYFIRLSIGRTVLTEKVSLVR